MMGERRIIPVTPNKRRAPALYELIAPKPRDGVDAPEPAARATPPTPTPSQPAPQQTPRPAQQAPATQPRPVAVAPATYDGDDDEPPSDKVLGITPGSRLNIPVGFAFVGVALVIAAIIAAYSLGFNKSERRTKERDDEQLQLQNQGIVDPTANNIPGILGGAPAGTNPAGNVAQPPKQTNAPKPQPPAEDAKPAVRVTLVKSSKDDPRKPGFNYPTVATLPIKEATAAAEYLVSKGYPTILAPSSSDTRLFVVVPLIGLERENYQKSSEAEARKLREIGRAFKRDQKGASDFNDLFWKKFDR